MSMRRSLPRIALTLVLAAIAGWVVLHRDQINLATLDAWLAWLGPWAPIGHMMLFALGTVAFVPGVVFSLAGGALFGPFWGSLWNLAGATLGATLAFLVARYIAGEWVARNAGGLLKRLIDGVDAEGWRFVAFVRLVPLFPFNLSNYALGLTRIPLVDYGIATLVCMAPGSSCLYVARSRRARGAERRSEFSPLWPSWARPACCHCGVAATDPPATWVVRMDRSKRTQVAARPRGSRRRN
jgi:uncharacterized membrane protein YdjX (TVP38/TMEM64 family)